ncbi:metal ABC transporter permease [Candidatus Finniella inopinata]|uniref:Metal ABC transporter permease n=1 Tax=Candidatus Finniella inopinata TaxID=1696036 RepID=A0A4Q7DIL7_9PROT|nr:metal ABC transporter permease [Candidatus Finniella inopinata]RZI46059.1 metal ABC transporter permease [Candidatus Finniella inopinata]
MTILAVLYENLFAPFYDYLFMQRALAACIAISLSSAPLGVILIQRRMSLIGEALSHGTLPGIALAYLVAGMWLPALILGGALAGLMVAFFSHFVSQNTCLKEDASFSSFYMIAFALGILILSLQEGSIKLVHLLFGNVLAVDGPSLIFMVATSVVSLVIFAIIYRPLIYECFDPLFMRSLKGPTHFYNFTFLTLMVGNLVAAYQALGTLMALGLMMIPAVAARLLAHRLKSIFLISILFALMSSYAGLLLSYHFNWPSGPTIVLVAGGLYIGSLVYVLAIRRH